MGRSNMASWYEARQSTHNEVNRLFHLAAKYTNLGFHKVGREIAELAQELDEMHLGSYIRTGPGETERQKIVVRDCNCGTCKAAREVSHGKEA